MTTVKIGVTLHNAFDIIPPEANKIDNQSQKHQNYLRDSKISKNAFNVTV